MYVFESNNVHTESQEFFIYGGCILDIDSSPSIHQGIEEVREKYGYEPTDKLKFSTNSTLNVTTNNQKLAKEADVDLARGAFFV